MKTKNPFLNPIYLTIIIFSVIIASLMIMGGNPPEFYDRFGLFVFGFLFFASIYMLKKKGKAPEWLDFLVFLIAILGLIVDGYNVFFS